ncbi:response regulator transcription factor [Salinarimonas soli]|uniref:Response regulator transcription factor n=1 Tax=Salinarimonas soli TaxID=1638099 RepID=A0A5B2VD77_9HYPH|nr:response regulator transcription factor [Salinarimonas soli]KAA2236636.1 response regulator transcription factor [Salinarimonas soli]
MQAHAGLPARPTIFVVEDDQAIRQGLAGLFRSIDLNVEVFASAADFLARPQHDRPGCLVVDVRLPGLSGLDFQVRLQDMGIRLPVILMTGHGDIPMSVRAMKAGAIDFLVKPFRDQDMLDAVATAIERDAALRQQAAARETLRANYATLSAREQEVFRLVTSGLMNKQVAGLLGLSEITVKVHRSNVMRKMNARSLADLVRLAEALEIAPT